MPIDFMYRGLAVNLEGAEEEEAMPRVLLKPKSDYLTVRNERAVRVSCYYPIFANPRVNIGALSHIPARIWDDVNALRWRTAFILSMITIKEC